jgi:hypothetical protein
MLRARALRRTQRVLEALLPAAAVYRLRSKSETLRELPRAQTCFVASGAQHHAARQETENGGCDRPIDRILVLVCGETRQWLVFEAPWTN